VYYEDSTISILEMDLVCQVVYFTTVYHLFVHV